MKTITKTLTIFALTLLCLFSAPQLRAGGTEVNNLEIELLSSENMIRRGNSLVMEVNIQRAGSTQLTVTDVNGRKVWHDALELKSGQNRVKFRVGDLPAGTYFLEVATESDAKIQTFAVR